LIAKHVPSRDHSRSDPETKTSTVKSRNE
jgi:hypothetical protein